MKKFCKSFFFIFIILFSCSSNVFSQNAGITSITSTTTCPGTIITLSVKVLHSPPLGVINLTIDYDASVLSALQNGNNSTFLSNVNPALAPITSDWGYAQTNKGPLYPGVKQAKVAWSGNGIIAFHLDTNSSGLAQLFDITFRYLGGTTTVSFDNSTQLGSFCEYDDSTGTVSFNDKPTSTYYISGTVSGYPTPSSPGLITGPLSPCQGTTASYSVVSSNGITYTWVAPAGWTGSSSSNAIVYTLSASAASGNITVTPSNICGSGAPSSIFVSPSIASTTPSSASASPPALCTGGGSTTLSVSGGSLGTGGVWRWFSGSCGGTSIGTGVSLIQSPAVTTIYYVRAQGTCNTTICDSVVVTMNIASVAPVSASANPASVCSGALSTLTVTGGSLGTFGVWKWYSGSCGGTFTGTGSSFVVGPTVTTPYYVRAEGSCNTTTCVNVSVQISLTSTPATSVLPASPSVCSGSSTTISESGGILGTGSNWHWYSVSCGGTPAGTNATVSVNPTITTVYYVRAEGPCNSTACISKTVTLSSLAILADSITSTPPYTYSVCGGAPLTLNESGGNLNGASWIWYSGSCGGIHAGSGSSVTISPATPTVYYVRAEGACNTTSCVSKTITIKANSTAAGSINATPSAICPGSSSTLSVNGGSLGYGAYWYWYNASCGGVLLGSGSSIVQNPVSQTVYYVRAAGSCNTTACVSLTLVLSSNSTAASSASLSPSSICSGVAVTLNETGGTLGSGANWYWYTGSCGSSYVISGTNVLVFPTVTSTYYVRAEGACNTTTCVSVISTVTLGPALPSTINAVPATINLSQSSTLFVTGTQNPGDYFKWYTGSCGSPTSVGTGISIVVSPSATTAYWVRNENGLCYSGCLSVTVTVNSLLNSPDSIIANPKNICSGSSSILNLYGTLNGGQWYWYSSSCGGTAITNGVSAITVNPVTTTNYYARQEFQTFHSNCLSSTVLVSVASMPPSGINATSTNICQGNQISLIETGGTLGSNSVWKWYSVSCGGFYESTGVTITRIPAISTTYFVRAEGFCNTTACAAISITVNSISVVPSSIVATPANICNGSNSTLTLAGGVLGVNSSWNWYTGSCGSSQIATGSIIIISPTSATTYFVRAVGPCNTTNCVNYTMTIGTLSVGAASISMSQSTLCSGSSASLSVVGGSTGTNSDWFWYTGSCGGTLAGTGLMIIQYPTITSTYFVRAEGPCNTTNCINSTLTVLISPSSPSSASANPSVIATGQNSTLTVTGTLSTGANWVWYENGCGTGLPIGNGNTLVVFPPATDSYYVRAENGTCFSACVSTIVTIPGSLNSPVSVFANPNPICGGQITTLGLAGTLNGGLWYWYTNGCGGTSVGIGSTVIVTPSTPTIYSVRQENGSGSVSGCGSVQVNFDTLSVLPLFISATPDTICAGSQTNLLISGQITGTNGVWKWYTGGCGVTPAGMSFSLVTTPSNSVVYYVRAEGLCNTTACMTVSVTVNLASSTPLTATGVPATICNGDTTILTKVGGALGSGANWTWYTGSCGGSYAGTGVTIFQEPSISTTFYVRAESGCNTTACVTKNIIVNIQSVQALGALVTNNLICAGSYDSLYVVGGAPGTNGEWIWYSASCGNVLAGTGSIIVVTPSISTTYYLRAEGTCNTTSCLSVSINVQQQSVNPGGLTATPSIICNGLSTVLSLNGGVSGTGANWMWYTGSCGSIAAGTGSSTTQFPTVTTVYYLRSEGICNTTSCLSITISVDSISVIPFVETTTTPTICAGNSSSISIIGGSLGSNAMWRWYSGSCGGAYEGSGTGITVSPSQTTVFFVRGEGYCNTTSCLSTSITIDPNSTTATGINANPSSVCMGSAMSLSITGGSTGTSGVWAWYSGTCGGVFAGNGTTIIQNPGLTTTYYVRSEGFCNTSSCISAVVTVNDSSSPPATVTASPSILCGGNSSSLTFAGGSLGTNANWYWYSGSCGGIFIGNGLTINQTPTISTTYFVRAEGLCNTTNCANAVVTVNSTSVTGPGATAIPPVICSGGSALLQTTGGVLGTGAGWYWYSPACGVNLIGNGASISQNPALTTTYYVRAENSCNTTICLSVTITVSSNSTTAASATSNPSIICSGSTSTISFTGGVLGQGAFWKWYSGSCGGTSLSTGLSITNNPIVSTTYYLRAESYCNTTSCVSTMVTVNSNSTSANFAYSVPSSICSGASSTLSINGGTLGTGGSWTWYSGSCNGTVTGAGISTIQSPVSTTVYYIKANGTCNTTNCVSVTVSVNSLSSAPVSASSLPGTICSGSSSSLAVAGGSLGTGATWNWYLNSCGGIVSGTGVTIFENPLSTGIYYVRAEGTCNTTNCVSVTVIVNPGSSPASLISSVPSTICSGTQVQLMVSGGYSGSNSAWKWYTGSCGGVYAGSGTILSQTPLATTIYYVRAEGSCNTTICTSFTTVVNTLSTAVTSVSGVPALICAGSSSVLTQNGGSAGTNSLFRWYSGYCGGTLMGAGNSISVSPSISTVYYVRVEGLCNTTACTSFNLQVGLLSTRTTSAIASAINICSGDSTVLTKTGGFLGSNANWHWYSGGCGITTMGSGVSKTIFPTATATYFIRAEGNCNTTLCSSITITVLSPSTLASGISATSSNICSGNSSTITITGGNLGTAGIWKWYSTYCGANYAGSGTTHIVSPAISTTYYVRAEGTCNTTNCLSKFINVNIFSVGASGVISSQASICTGGLSNLTVTGGILGSGAAWYWYTGSCGVTFVSTNSTIVISPAVTTTYWVRAQGICNTTVCVSTTVILNNISSPAVMIIPSPSSNVCSGTQVTLISSGGVLGTGADWYWYTGSCGGTFAGNTMMNIVSPVVNTVYYVRAEGTCNTTNCTSIAITLISLPSQPSQVTGNVNPTNGTNEVYSVINDPNVSNYSWTAPAGWIGSSFSNTINYVIGAGSGPISIVPSNACGNGPSRTLDINVGYNISGYFTYDNTSSTPLDSVMVYLKSNGNIIGTTQADINGYYSFSNIINGTYTVMATTHKPWTGVNSTDASKVIRHFNNLELLTSSIKLHSADVNLSLSINANDAAKITRRFLGYDTSFARGNWIFEKPFGGDTINVSSAYNDTIIVNNNDVPQDFKGLCVGDVNGSNMPGTGAKSVHYSTSMIEQGLLRVNNHTEFEIPIRVNRQMEISAISLILDYPAGLVEITGVSSDNFDISYNNNKNGEIRVAWYDLYSKSTDGDNIIITLKAILHGNPNNKHLISLARTDLNELADDNGQTIDNVVLIVPKIESGENLSSGNFIDANVNSANIYPNPANNKVTINCNFNGEGNLEIKLYNVVGGLVKDFTNEEIKGGNITKEFAIRDISAGIYMCKIQFTGAGGKFEKLLKLVITR